MFKKILLLIPLLFLFSCDQSTTTEMVTSAPQTQDISTYYGGGQIEYIGPSSISIVMGDTYDYDSFIRVTDPGYQSLDYYCLDNGGLNTNIPGTYILVYTLFIKGGTRVVDEIERTVIVVNRNPVIETTGPLYFFNNVSNQDLLEGVTAVDYLGNDITSLITYTSNIDYSRPNKYTVTYTVTDTFGYSSTLNRTVYINYLEDLNIKSQDELDTFLTSVDDRYTDISVKYATSVSSSQTLTAVGAPKYNDFGAVVIYDQSGNQVLFIDGANYLGQYDIKPMFGEKVIITDTHLIIGAPKYRADNEIIGALFIFPIEAGEINLDSYQFIQDTTLRTSSKVNFGSEFNAEDGYLAVSIQNNHNGTNEKKVIIYQLDETGTYQKFQTILPQKESYYYGYKVLINDEYLAIASSSERYVNTRVDLYKLSFISSENTYRYVFDREITLDSQVFDQSFAQDMELYNNYLILNVASKKGKLVFYDLNKTSSDQDYYFNLYSPVENYDEQFGFEFEIDGDHLYVLSNEVLLNEASLKGLYVYHLTDVFNGVEHPVSTYQLTNQDVGGYGSAFEVYNQTLYIGSNLTPKTTYHSGRLDVLSYSENIIQEQRVSYLTQIAQSFEIKYNDKVVSDFDFSNIMDGNYILKFMKGGLEYRFDILIDTTSPIVSHDVFYSQSNTTSIQVNELIYKYQINDGDIINLASESKLIEIELSENGKYNITLFDILDNQTTITYYYDDTIPSVSATRYEIGDLYSEISVDNLQQFSCFSYDYDYNNNLLISSTRVLKDRSVLHGYAYLFTKIDHSFTYLTKISQPYDNNDYFANKVALNEDDIFVSSLVVEEDITYSVIYIYHRNSSDFITPDDVIILPAGSLKTLEIEENTLVALMTQENTNNAYIYDLSSPDYPYTLFNKLDEESITDISISNNLIALGTNNLHVYIYDIDTSLTREIIKPNVFGDFGTVVSIYNNYLAVKSTKNICVFNLNLSSNFTDYYKVITFDSEDIGNDLSLNERYLAVSNSRFDMVYLIGLNSEDINLSKIEYVQDNTFEFATKIMLEEDFMLVNHPRNSNNTYAGTLNYHVLSDFYKINVDDLTNSFEVYQVVEGEHILINQPYLFDTNQMIEVYVEDLAGNAYHDSFDFNDLYIYFINRDDYTSDNFITIKTNKYFNAYSLDGGLTYISIDATKEYLVEGLQNGNYDIVVRYNDIIYSKHVLHVTVDYDEPVISLVESNTEDFIERLLLLDSFRGRQEATDFLIYEQYVILSYYDEVYIFDTLSETPEQYVELLTYSDTGFGSRLQMLDNYLVVGAYQELNNNSKGAIYLFDLSLIGQGDIFVQKLIDTSYSLFALDFIVGGNYLFTFSGNYVDTGIYSYEMNISMYTFNHSTNQFEFARVIDEYISENYPGYRSFVMDMEYYNLKLAVDIFRFGTVIYDLSSPNEVEKTIFNRYLNGNIEFNDHLLIVSHSCNYNEETDIITEVLYFYDLNDSDLEVDYIFEIITEESSLKPFEMYLEGYKVESSFSILDNGNLFTASNYTFYDISMFYDGIDSTDEPVVSMELFLENESDYITEYNGRNAEVGGFYVEGNDVYLMLYPLNKYYSDTVIFKYTEASNVLMIEENSEYEYVIYYNGELYEPLNPFVISEDGIYEFHVLDRAGNEVVEVINFDINNPMITSKTNIIQDSYTITSNELFNYYSIDGGITFQEIQPTTSYTLSSLENGEYSIMIKDISGKTSSSVSVIIDHLAPIIIQENKTLGDVGYEEILESKYSWMRLPVIYNGYVYYIYGDGTSNTLQKIKIENNYLNREYNQLFYLDGHVINAFVHEDTLILITDSLEHKVIFIDLTKSNSDEGFKKEYILQATTYNAYDELGEIALVVNNKLVLTLDYNWDNDVDRFVILDLGLAFDDPNFETEYIPSSIVLTDFLGIEMFSFDHYCVTVSLSSSRHIWMIQMFDFSLDPSDPNFETLVDLSLLNIDTFVYQFAYNETGQLVFEQMHLDGSKQYYYIDLTQPVDVSSCLVSLDEYILGSINVDQLFYEGNTLIATEKQIDGSRDVYIIDMTKMFTEPNYYEVFNLTEISDETSFSEIYIKNNQLFIRCFNMLYSYYLTDVVTFDVVDNSIIESISVTLDGEDYYVNSYHQLMTPGTYVITVTDVAGNITVETIIVS